MDVGAATVALARLVYLDMAFRGPHDADQRFLGRGPAAADTGALGHVARPGVTPAAAHTPPPTLSGMPVSSEGEATAPATASPSAEG